jgi:hypothetical protein
MLKIILKIILKDCFIFFNKCFFFENNIFYKKIHISTNNTIMVETNLYYPSSSLITYKTQRPKVQNNQPSKCVTFVLMFSGYMIHFYITYVIVFF